MSWIKSIERVTGIYKVTPQSEIIFELNQYKPGDTLYAFGVNQEFTEGDSYKIILVDLNTYIWYQTDSKYVKRFFSYIEEGQISEDTKNKIIDFIKQNNVIFKEANNVKFIQ